MLEHQLQPLGFLVEILMMMSLHRLKESHPKMSLVQKPSNEISRKRMERLREAGRLVKELKRDWDQTSLDRNFFLNTERDLLLAISDLSTAWAYESIGLGVNRV